MEIVLYIVLGLLATPTILVIGTGIAFFTFIIMVTLFDKIFG